MPVRSFLTFRDNGETRMQTQTGGGVLGTQEHTLVLDRQLVASAIIRRLMLTTRHTPRSQPHRRPAFPVSKVSTTHLRHRLCHALDLDLDQCLTTHRNALLLTMRRSNLCQVSAIGSV